jgi:hypothetical protein
VRTDRQKYDRALERQLAPRREAQRAIERERLLHNARPTKEKITQALDLRGLYGPEVDNALGGEEPMVDEWEAGTLTPTPDQMIALANLTQFPIEFFYIPIIEMPEPFVCFEIAESMLV